MNKGDIIKQDGKLYVVVEVYETNIRVMGLDGIIRTIVIDDVEEVEDE